MLFAGGHCLCRLWPRGNTAARPHLNTMPNMPEGEGLITGGPAAETYRATHSRTFNLAEDIQGHIAKRTLFSDIVDVISDGAHHPTKREVSTHTEP